MTEQSDNTSLEASPDIEETSSVASDDLKTWATVLHISLLAGFVIPMAGLIAPILIWLLKRDQIAGLDAHGKSVLNWLISLFIYGTVCFILTFIFIGIPLLMVLGVLSVVFPIVGAVKANEGQLWKYPLSLTLIK